MPRRSRLKDAAASAAGLPDEEELFDLAGRIGGQKEAATAHEPVVLCERDVLGPAAAGASDRAGKGRADTAPPCNTNTPLDDDAAVTGVPWQGMVAVAALASWLGYACQPVENPRDVRACARCLLDSITRGAWTAKRGLMTTTT